MPSPPLPTQVSFSMTSSPTADTAHYFSAAGSIDNSLHHQFTQMQNREQLNDERQPSSPAADQPAVSQHWMADDEALPPRVKVQAPSASPDYSLRQMSSNELLNEEAKMAERKLDRIEQEIKRDFELERAKQLRDQVRQARSSGDIFKQVISSETTPAPSTPAVEGNVRIVTRPGLKFTLKKSTTKAVDQGTTSKTDPPASPSKSPRIQAIRQRFEGAGPTSPTAASTQVRQIDIDGNSFTHEYHPVSPIEELTEKSSITTRRSALTKASASRSAIDRCDSFRSAHSRTASLPTVLQRASLFEPIAEETSAYADAFGATSPNRRAFNAVPTFSNAVTVAEKEKSLPASSNIDSDGAILYEGNILAPPSSTSDIFEALSSPSLWSTRYAVLTTDSFEFRPTDVVPVAGRSIAFRVKDCQSVADRSLYERFDQDGFYPFVVRLSGGQELCFASKSRKDRVNWTSHIEDRVLLEKRPKSVASAPNSPVKTAFLPHHSTHDRSDALSEQSSLFGHSKSRRPPVQSPPLVQLLWTSPPMASNRGRELPQPPASHFVQSPESDLHLFRQAVKPIDSPHSFLNKSLSEVATASAASAKSTYEDLYDRVRPALVELLEAVRQRQGACVVSHPSSSISETASSIDAAMLAQSSEVIKALSETHVRSRDPLSDEDHRALLSKMRHVESLLRTLVKSKVSTADGTSWAEWQLKLLLDVEKDLCDILRLPADTSGPRNKWCDPSRDVRHVRSQPSLRHPSPHRPFATTRLVQDDYARTFRDDGVQAYPSPKQDSDNTRRRSSSLVSRRSAIAIEQLVSVLNRDLEKQAAEREEAKAHQELATSFMQALYKDLLAEREDRAREREELAQQLKDLQSTAATIPERVLSTLTASPCSAANADAGSESAKKRHTAALPGSLSDGAIHKLSVLERKMSGNEGSSPKRRASGSSKVGGPRMPRINARIWGAPEPTDNRKVHFGSVKRKTSSSSSTSTVRGAAKLSKERYGGEGNIQPQREGENEKSALAEAIENDPALTQALENLASGGDINDAATLSLAVYEILALMREQKKKLDEEEKRKADKAKAGLSKDELAELEVKRAEVERIRQAAKQEAAANSRLDALVTKLAAKSDAHEALLKAVAEEVKSPRQQTLDPKLTSDLSSATKALLGQVKSGVDSHVKEFRAQLTGEVQRMFKEVNRLKEQKKALELEVSELLAFRAKQGGPVSIETKLHKDPPSNDPGVGFFGPRPPK